MNNNVVVKIVVTIALAIMAIGLMGADSGCGQPTSDEKQRVEQEKILAEGTAQVGMPAIKNFRERKILKDIIELRDQEGLVTFTYIENMNPTPVKGKTALGGKLTYLGESIGYGIPYATQFTNPEKIEYHNGYVAMPQADPNGLFSPESAEGTWVLLKDPKGDKVQPVYVEPRIVVSPFRLPAD